MLATILTFLLVNSLAAIQPTEEQILRQFAAFLENYAQLHRRASESIPRALCGGPEELEIFRLGVAQEIRRLRVREREGAIFTREVGTLLRRRLHTAAPHIRLGDEDAHIGPDGQLIRWVPEVNGEYPPDFSIEFSVLVQHLPPLPGEMEYRFVGRDLVLLDVVANLVVDVLRDAIP